MGTRELLPGERCTNCRHDSDIGHAFAQLDEATWQDKSDKYRCQYVVSGTPTGRTPAYCTCGATPGTSHIWGCQASAPTPGSTTGGDESRPRSKEWHEWRRDVWRNRGFDGRIVLDEIMRLEVDASLATQALADLAAALKREGEARADLANADALAKELQDEAKEAREELSLAQAAAYSHADNGREARERATRLGQALEAISDECEYEEMGGCGRPDECSACIATRALAPVPTAEAKETT